MSSIQNDVPSGLKNIPRGWCNMKDEFVSLRDQFVSEACVNGKISELRKWSIHFAFHFPKKTEEAV